MNVLEVDVETTTDTIVNAIIEGIRLHESVEINVLSSMAISQTMIAVSSARDFLATHGRDLICIPEKAVITQGNKELVILKLVVEPRLSYVINTKRDRYFLAEDVPLAKIANHENCADYLSYIGNHPGKRILEIGSREVTGRSDAKQRFALATYCGFDYYSGPNVDVNGDAHKLSHYFSEAEKFDLVFSRACFEHFAMPWIVAMEIAKVLKVGGVVFIETHFSFASHERPWHFFQFSDMALKVLFSPALGFECIEAGFSNPLVARFSSLADINLKNRFVKGLYCHCSFLGKKVKDVDRFDWAEVDLSALVENTKYPEPRV